MATPVAGRPMANPISRVSIGNLNEPFVFIKIPEIVLLLIAIITFCLYKNGSPAYALSVLVPSLLNAIIFLMLYIMGYTQLRQIPVELALYSYNVVGLFISSILLMSSWFPSLITSGVFCLFLVIIYCIEVYFSYIGLTTRPPLLSDSPGTQTNPQYAHSQPAVISDVYSSSGPPILTLQDDADLGLGTVQHISSNTNPVYPETLNYPPYPMPNADPPQYSPTPFNV